MKKYSLASILIASIILSVSCDRNINRPARLDSEKEKTDKLTRLEVEGVKKSFIAGEPIQASLIKPDGLILDSVQLFFGGKLLETDENTSTFSIATDNFNPGSVALRLKVYYNDSIVETDSKQITLLSDIVPTKYKYRVVNTFVHDVGAYTQGLQYYNGWLYEGTGNYNQSTLRKVRLQNGEVLQSRNNASDIFGEGITIFKGKIYQLTYKARICYVYDLNTFEEIQKFYFQNQEGWGLTNSEDELIMSDGSHILYFIDPEMFTIKRQLEVYNNEGPVTSLNELEYINGKIYANRYYTDEIVIIDPETGKVEGRVDLKGILSVKDRKPSTNVLNGIAWDNEQKRLFVTGKYWPKLFEIKLVPEGE